jgi:predicted ATPase
MVLYLLGAEKIDTALEELILEKSEGIPLFIEEFIQSLNDMGIIEKKNNGYYLSKHTQEITIPSTIQDIIMARVDTLPDDAKEVLQTGSVIEREFSYELIRLVMDLPHEQLLSRMSILKDAEFFYERGIFPQSTYIFKHALTQEVVYNSILTGRRKKLHEMIGKAIEELYKRNIDEKYEVLAEHYIAGENYEKSAEYSRLAAKKAEKIFSLNDAITYTRKRITSLEKLPQTDDIQKKLNDARVTLGFYGMLQSPP